MSNKNQRGQEPHKKGRRQFRISVKAVQREMPDVRKLARAAIELAMAQAEADAEHTSNKSSSPAEDREVADD